MYDSWVAQGKSAPVVMRRVTVPVSITVDVAEDPGREPLVFSLTHGSPNPFRTETSLNYSLPHRERVSIGVYDVRGRLVRTLVDRFQDAGRYVATWNGRDSRDTRMASGIYIVRYQAGSMQLVRRTVLLR